MGYAKPRGSQTDFVLEIPAQTGLTIPLSINLQNDELTLCISGFHAHWFPCTDQSEIDHFVHCAVGFVKGTIRVQETLRGQRVVRAELQEQAGTDWKAICISRMFSLSRAKETTRIIANESV